jgi:hypothetical protein
MTVGSLWGKSQFAELLSVPSEFAERSTSQGSSLGLWADPAEAPFRRALPLLGVTRSRPRALLYSGAWVPRSRTTPGALRTTPRRRFGRLGREAWRSWP